MSRPCSHTLPNRRLESHTQTHSAPVKTPGAVHGRSGCRRFHVSCALGSQSERAVNVRTGALSLEADAPVVAAAAASPLSSGGSRRRIRRVDGSSSNSSSSSSGRLSSSSSILTRLSLSAESFDPTAAAAAAATADAAVASHPSSTSTSSHSISTSTSTALPDTPAHAAASSSTSAAAASSTPPASPAAAAAGVDGPSSSSSTSTLDEEEAEYAKQLQGELSAAKCCQDILDIVADEVAHFQSYHAIGALSRLAKLSKGLSRPQRLEVLADPGFVKLLGRLCQQALGGALSPMELSNALYSCGVMQVPIETLKLRSSDSSSSSGSAPAALDALEAAIKQHAAEFNDRDVSSTLYGYAQLRLRRPASLPVIGALVSRAQSLLSKGACSPRCTSMTLWALATLFGGSSGGSSGSSGGGSSQGVPVNAFAAAAARWLASEGVSFDELGSQGVANSLWGSVKLGSREEELLGKALEWLAANAGSCKMQEVLNILWAAGACRHRPLQLGSIVAHVAQHAEALKPADMASLFHVLGIFGFDFSSKQDQLDRLLARAAALLPQMKPFEVTSLYWGLGMTRQVDSALFRDITGIVSRLQQQQLQAAARLADLQQQEEEGAAAGEGAQQSQQQQQQEVVALQAKARQLSESLQRQAFQAYIAARLEGVAVELPADVLDALRGAWLAGNRGGSRGGKGQQQSQSQQQRQDPLLIEFEWFLQELRVKGRVGVRSKLDKLLAVDVEVVASGQRLVALQLLPDAELDSMGSKLAAVQWEEDVLRRNGYDEVFWLRVSEYRGVPKPSRPRYFADLLRKLGVSPQERLVAAAEKAWVGAGCKPAGGSGRGGSGGAAAGGWGSRAAAGDITASEADILMQDGSSSAGGWASGGRGSRSKRSYTKRR